MKEFRQQVMLQLLCYNTGLWQRDGRTFQQQIPNLWIASCG